MLGEYFWINLFLFCPKCPDRKLLDLWKDTGSTRVWFYPQTSWELDKIGIQVNKASFVKGGSAADADCSTWEILINKHIHIYMCLTFSRRSHLNAEEPGLKNQKKAKLVVLSETLKSDQADFTRRQFQAHFWWISLVHDVFLQSCFLSLLAETC